MERIQTDSKRKDREAKTDTTQDRGFASKSESDIICWVTACVVMIWPRHVPIILATKHIYLRNIFIITFAWYGLSATGDDARRTPCARYKEYYVTPHMTLGVLDVDE